MHDVSMFIQQSTSIHHLQNSACTGKYWAPLNDCYPMCVCPDGVKQCLCVPMYVCQPAKCFKQAFTDLILKAKQIILGHSVPNTNACHYFSSSLFKFIGFLTPPLSKSHVIVNSCHILSHPSHTHTHTLYRVYFQRKHSPVIVRVDDDVNLVVAKPTEETDT